MSASIYTCTFRYLCHRLNIFYISDICPFLIHKKVRSVGRVHQKLLRRIGNSHGKSFGNCHGKERSIDKASLRQTEGNVGKTAYRGKSSLLLAVFDGL